MKRVHFIGIGGIGMSGLASVLLERGILVTGSDIRPNNLTDELARRGAGIYKGHDASNVPADADLVVRTTCIRDDNPEVLRAGDLRKDIITRSALLGILMEEAPVSIGITGTHGKTTTSALVACIMEHCGKEPTVIVGGEMEKFGSNAKQGGRELLVAEVDESDGYFRSISATHAVVTNIEREHMEHFGSFEDLVGSYREFISRVSPGGVLVFNGEDTVLRGLAGSAAAKRISFGMDGYFDVTCGNCACAGSIEFDFMMSGKKHGRVRSPLIGRHNVMNILAAMAVSMGIGLGFEKVAEAVKGFHGVKRRFDLIGRSGSVRVVEDYAHHPTELRAVIRAAKEYGPGRVIAVFQPHRYSRTRDLADGFAECFYDADILVLTDIYSADEDPAEGPGIADIYEKMDKRRFLATELLKKDRIPEFVAGIVRDDDIVLVLGAGDIRDISGVLLDEIRKRRPDVE